MPLRQQIKWLTVIAIGIAVAVGAGLAHAQQKNFPNKPVRWVTVGAGSQNDLVARIVAPKLTEIWGQPLVIENRTGAGGAFAASTVAKAAPDGYTLLMLSSQFSIGAAVHKNLPYDAVRDFAGVTQIGFSTNTLIVAPSLGVRSVKELIAFAQAKPAQILFSSASAGSGTHMNGERFRLAAGIKARPRARNAGRQGTAAGHGLHPRTDLAGGIRADRARRHRDLQEGGQARRLDRSMMSGGEWAPS